MYYNVKAPYEVSLKTDEPILWGLQWYLSMEFWKFAWKKPGGRFPLSIMVRVCPEKHSHCLLLGNRWGLGRLIPSRIVMFQDIPKEAMRRDRKSGFEFLKEHPRNICSKKFEENLGLFRFSHLGNSDYSCPLNNRVWTYIWIYSTISTVIIFFLPYDFFN